MSMVAAAMLLSPNALCVPGNKRWRLCEVPSAAETLDRLEGEGRVAFRYTGEVNGSARNIAGVLNSAGNVLGMMPHPERALESAHGNTDGRRLFEGLLEAVS